MKYYQTECSEGSFGSQGVIIAESLDELLCELKKVNLYGTNYYRAVKYIEYKELELPMHINWYEC